RRVLFRSNERKKICPEPMPNLPNNRKRAKRGSWMHNVIIVGAGPAGLSAAIACRMWGLNVLALDEFPKPGGRLLGQLHQEPSGEWWNGIKEAGKLFEEAEEHGAEIRCGISVHHFETID